MRYKELGKRKIQVIKREFKEDIVDIINYDFDGGNKIQTEHINAYRELKQKLKCLGYKDRKQLMNGLTMRDYIFQQTGISQSQGYKLEYIEKNDLKLFVIYPCNLLIII